MVDTFPFSSLRSFPIFHSHLFATDLDEEFNQKDLEETSFDRIILFVEIVRKNLGGGNVEF